MAIDALYKVAYDEAVRVLSEQESVLDSLRSRAGVLFSAAAITTSFLGARALHGADWRPFSWSPEPASIEDLHRELSFHIYASYLENRGALRRLVVCFQIANVLFAVELMLWMAAIASIA